MTLGFVRRGPRPPARPATGRGAHSEPRRAPSGRRGGALGLPRVPAPSGPAPTPAGLEREAQVVLGRLRRMDAADAHGAAWSPEAIDRIARLLTEFHRRLDVLVRADHDPAALPHVLATRRCIAQAQLIVLGRLADLCVD